MYTTNYYNTFIEVADDCPVAVAEIPSLKGNEKTVANIEFEMLKTNPYRYTSDEILFHVYVVKNDIANADIASEKEKFFSKGQPCFRSSPLGKRYGWGIHYNAEGKMAVYALESEEYRKLAEDKNFKIIKAMRSKRIK